MKVGRKPFGFYQDEEAIVKIIKLKRRLRKGSDRETAYSQIARELNAERHHTQTGCRFTAQTVKNILNPVPPPVKKKYPANQQPKRYWSKQEVARIFEACRSDFEKAVMYVLVGSGLRAAEVLALQMRDMSLRGKGSLIHVCHGVKKAKNHSVLISVELAEWLAMYIKDYRGAAGKRDKMFVQPRNGGVWYYHNLYDLTTRIGRRAGLAETANPHSFRHTFATLLYDHKKDLEFVQQQLGHASIKTTAIYSKCVDKSKLEQMAGLGETLWGRDV